MFRSLIDGGASGSCMFNYSDGWWKAGNELVHDDAAEEWFGLVEYTDLTDKYGTPRPVWDSLIATNRAVIVSPKNQEIYGNEIPVELFTTDTIHKCIAVMDNTVILDELITDNYFQDTLYIALDSIRDISLTFNFYTAQELLIRTETVQILASVTPFQLPQISIEVTPHQSGVIIPYWQALVLSTQDPCKPIMCWITFFIIMSGGIMALPQQPI